MLNRFVVGAGAMSLLLSTGALAQDKQDKQDRKAQHEAAKAEAKAAKAEAKQAGMANRLSPAERKAGWRPLFDGKSTKGWRGYKKDTVPEAWKVAGGVLMLDGKGGDLITTDQFADFELSVDWRIGPKGNSGIIYRSTETDGPSYVTGPEYQLLDDAGHPDATQGTGGNHRAGSLYDIYAPAKAVAKPANEWNTTKIVAQGKKVEHWLNGEKVVDADLGSAEWGQKVAASKWAKHAQYGKMDKGHIVLQEHGDKVEFRNIKIRDLAVKK